jgi:hypothetical protein
MGLLLSFAKAYTWRLLIFNIAATSEAVKMSPIVGYLPVFGPEILLFLGYLTAPLPSHYSRAMLHLLMLIVFGALALRILVNVIDFLYDAFTAWRL